MTQQTLKFLSIKDLKNKIGISTATIWRLEKGGDFPKKIQITRGRVAWVESEVNDWMQSRIKI